MQTTIFKLWLPAWTALGILLCLGLQSGCKSPQAGAPTRVASRTDSPLNQGAAATVFQDSAKGDSAFLATIPISCPTDPRYRLPGFSMKCNECHHPQTPESKLPEDRARQRSQACSANLKYIGLAARTWATNHNGYLPSNFASMARELISPLVAACPEESWDAVAQKNKYQYFPKALVRLLEPNPLEVPTWSTLDRTRATYQIFSPRARRRDPASAYVRCRIHGLVLRADGSVVSPIEGR